MHPLILVAVEEALRWRVVPAVALAAHRANHPVLFQPRLKGVAGLAALGGGSLASGDLGMAGGSALVAGAGALSGGALASVVTPDDKKLAK
jgi:hypothetical protein